jgi:hypothetical protein
LRIYPQHQHKPSERLSYNVIFEVHFYLSHTIFCKYLISSYSSRSLRVDMLNTSVCWWTIKSPVFYFVYW